MTWGKLAIEKLFGESRGCDLCRKPATAFHAGRSRCEDHLTGEMLAQRQQEVLLSRPTYPGRPQLTNP